MTAPKRIQTNLDLPRLGSLPDNVPVAILLRHSIREELPIEKLLDSVPITEEGVRIACELGGLMGSRLCGLHASPVIRCVQTAQALAEGASVSLDVVPDRHLGDPGVFVSDRKKAHVHWVEGMGHNEVMRHLTQGDKVLDGFMPPGPAAHLLLRHMIDTASVRSGIHVFVTHDSVIGAAVARLFDWPVGPQDWPDYLEGAFFWEENGTVRGIYRDRAAAVDLKGI